MMKQTQAQYQFRIQVRISRKKMDNYQDKMKSALGEEESAPAGDSTRSEE